MIHNHYSYLWCFISLFFVGCNSGIQELKEEEIPVDLPKFQIISSKENVFDGYIFIRKLENPGAQLMINNKGKVVWFQRSDTTIQREFIPYPKSYLSLYNEKELHEISYRGDTLLKLKYGSEGFQKSLHHEIFIDSKNRIVALTKDISLYDFSNFGGNKLDTLKTDGILVLSRDGEKLWEWSFKNVLDTMSLPGVDLFQIKNDLAHANSLVEDTDGNYVISWRDLNEVWKINSQTGDVLWRYGGQNRIGNEILFKGQHVIHKNLDGNYMIFNNGPNKTNFSSGAIGFDLDGDRLRNKFEVSLPDSIFTLKEGSVYQIDADKFLFCVTRTNDLIIMNKAGEIFWHAKSDLGFYRAYYLDKSVLE